MGKKRDVPDPLGNWGLTQTYLDNMLTLWSCKTPEQSHNLGQLQLHVEPARG